MLPAYAGMIRHFLTEAPVRVGAPRVCGDDPGRDGVYARAPAVLPAYAGMIPFPRPRLHRAPSAPRVCGDDPAPWTVVTGARGCSPRMRG